MRNRYIIVIKDMIQYCYMSTNESLRRDHMLIEKMIDALKIISSLLAMKAKTRVNLEPGN